ncbi:PadR family transcriptional regulator [Streptomyces rectiverticillatus]|uniref:PadR family transcriptional regulator n=1 Tax=Streptomyces rectiverticillatus TaxID=173860 RepID=UPI0015C37B33|nr:PadR family transcriptional regulator [Streptomyces rectiverticillatus]QLE73931.1 PadR family transcriptional regulator [Streptomyces rectiverticillatus]
MPPVFAHGRLRLYLLKLLDEAPRHGYEIIRLLEERFQGLYAPSAGTVYPRLAKLEAEGLIAHTTEGGRKVYAITAAGRAELAGRQGELAELELEIRESVAALAADIREEVRGAAGDLRRQVREAARQTRAAADPHSFDSAKEDFRRAKEQWKEQARQAKEESRRARQDAQQARHQAREAQQWAHEEVRRATRRVQEQVEEHLRRGDWPTGVAEGVSALAKEFGAFASRTTSTTGQGCATGTEGPESAAGGAGAGSGAGAAGTRRPEPPAGPAPEWAEAGDTPSEDPARDLDRLLDRFRDDIRDAARDHGVSRDQLEASRRHLADAAIRITSLLRPGG